ncbi:hypothetical protein PR048_030802 [Dryococelus australis]|uniref:Uncharacterized protein n=1 Tax=Dryococelus australis TaxID=614101 RepID=A0ABQ9G9X4_9NEOP|nr:hypothetical protein PR048_030802 [Dryococelus australis]
MFLLYQLFYDYERIEALSYGECGNSELKILQVSCEHCFDSVSIQRVWTSIRRMIGELLFSETHTKVFNGRARKCDMITPARRPGTERDLFQMLNRQPSVPGAHCNNVTLNIITIKMVGDNTKDKRLYALAENRRIRIGRPIRRGLGVGRRVFSEKGSREKWRRDPCSILQGPLIGSRYTIRAALGEMRSPAREQMRVKRGEHRAAPKCKGENPGSTPPGIEPGSPGWEAGSLTTSTPSWPHAPLKIYLYTHDWLDCSPPAWVKRICFPAESFPDVRTWESCLTTSLVGGFSRGAPVSPTLAFWCHSIPIYRAKWRSGNSGGPGFESRSGRPDFGSPWFPRDHSRRMLGWVPNKGHGRFLPSPPAIPRPCVTFTVSNDLAVDETLSPIAYLPYPPRLTFFGSQDLDVKNSQISSLTISPNKPYSIVIVVTKLVRRHLKYTHQNIPYL